MTLGRHLRHDHRPVFGVWPLHGTLQMPFYDFIHRCCPMGACDWHWAPGSVR